MLTKTRPAGDEVKVPPAELAITGVGLLLVPLLKVPYVYSNSASATPVTVIVTGVLLLGHVLELL